MRRTLIALLLSLASHVALGNDHVVILLDTSGSMSERMRSTRSEKIDVAKQSLQKVIDQMPSSTKVGLLTFDGWAFPIGTVDKIQVQQSLAGMSTGGGTPLGSYMKMGADALLDVREKNHGLGTYTLLVVTDGEATDGNLMDEYTLDIVSRGITLKTIGLDLGKVHTLSRLSVAYFSADNPSSLDGALRQAIAEIPSGDDNVEEDAYAMLASIPNDMVPNIITSLTDTITFNQPIGEEPKSSLVNVDTSFLNPQPTSSGSGFWWVGIIVILILFMIGIIFVMMVLWE